MSAWQATPYSLLFALFAVFCALVASVIWRRRPAPGAVALACVVIGCCQWLVASALQWARADLDGALFWFTARFIGTELLTVAFLTFAAVYRGRSWIGPRLIAALFVVPAITTLLAITNAWHHEFFRTARMVDIGGAAALDVSFGPVFWIHTAYDYVLLWAGLYLVFEGLLKSPPAYRGQIVAIVVGTLAPLAANTLTLSGHNPFPHVDLTPIGFAVTSGAFLIGFLRFSLFEIVPAARDRVIEYMRDAVFVLDDQDRVVDLNPAAQSLVGPKSRTPIGKPIAEAFGSASPLLEAGSVKDLEQRELRLRVGGAGETATRDFELHVSPVGGRDGIVTGRVLLLHDVTEYKQTRERLRQSEETSSTILENIEDAYYELDLTGKFTKVTAATARVVGVTRDDMIGRSFADFTDEETAKRLFKVYSTMFRTGEPVRELEYQIIDSTGAMRILEASASLIRDENGKPIGFRGTGRNVTARKQAERELREAKEAAETASRAKGAFLATVSHELRTPLTAVLGFAKLIKKRFSDVLMPALTGSAPAVDRAARQVAANLDIIVSEGERLTALINDVLDLAKIESGKMQWQMRPMRIAAVIEQAVAATTALAEQKDLQIVTEVEETLPMIEADPDRLMQVVVNLLSNAVKFTDQGRVTCRARRTGQELVVSVIDTGIGIATEEHDKIFEQFVQVSDTLTGKPTGTGLGLPICQEIVERHGGRIWVESEPGRGSTFSFTLPIQQPGVAAVTPPRVELKKLMEQLRHEVAAATASNGSGRKTILIADDEPSMCLLLRQELEAAGFDVREAHDGAEALAAIRAERPNLVILDVLMPGLSGFDVAAVLRSDPRTYDIPIVILSVIQDRAQGMRLGVDHYFTKPVDTAVLVREVGLLLAEGQSRKKVLVVDEDSQTLRMLSSALEARGYAVTSALGAEEGIAKATVERPDLVMVRSLVCERHDLVKTLRLDKQMEAISFLLFE
jgi:PAS domain S-box-containing protein